MQDTETGCCPKFDPKPWDQKEIEFKNRLFVKDKIFCFFNIPLNFGKVMTQNMAKIEAAQALPTDFITLYDCTGLFGADIYIAISKEIPETQTTTISGTFLTKVFEGSYKNTGEWIKQMQEYVKSKNKLIQKLYFYYTTCPKCAKHYGKNYTVLLAKV